MRVRTESKRDAIVETAGQVFAELGYERTSMSEIAARIGGSKATLYGYFASKEELFLAVSQAAARQHLAPAFSEFDAGTADLPATLRRFGEKAMAFLCSAQAVMETRMVIGESGNSDTGCRFYESGPCKGLQVLGDFLLRAMDDGNLRRADPEVASRHLHGLLQSELLWPLLYGAKAVVTRPQIRAAVDRGVAVFMAAYAPSDHP